MMLVSAGRIPSPRLRNCIQWAIGRLEGEDYEFFSRSLRSFFLRHYGVEIGMYSHGGCFVPGRFPPGTKIGRYCSIAASAQSFDANHPMNMKSSHAFFFNSYFGLMAESLNPRTRLSIGNDVWLGHGSIILPSVSTVGDGAVVAAGAVVNKNIPPYAVVVGNPARVVRFRFSKERIAQLLEERWWRRDIDDLVRNLDEFLVPVEGESVR